MAPQWFELSLADVKKARVTKPVTPQQFNWAGIKHDLNILVTNPADEDDLAFTLRLIKHFWVWLKEGATARYMWHEAIVLARKFNLAGYTITPALVKFSWSELFKLTIKTGNYSLDSDNMGYTEPKGRGRPFVCKRTSQMVVSQISRACATAIEALMDKQPDREEIAIPLTTSSYTRLAMALPFMPATFDRQTEVLRLQSHWPKESLGLNIRGWPLDGKIIRLPTYDFSSLRK